MRSFLSAFALALGLIWLMPVVAAQAQCYDFSNETTKSCEYAKDYPAGESLNTGATRAIVKIIDGATNTCGSEIVELRYRIDCLRVYYMRVAESLPDTGEYLPIKKAMEDAAARLDAIVEANLDESSPRIRPREGHKPAAKRLPAIRPVQEDMAEIAAAQAAEVIRETELIIIRSGGDPARRTEHYTDVAAAVEDNLVILRSA